MESKVVKEYKECYIAFLDILGFKELVKEKSCAFIAKIIDKINYSDSGSVPIFMAEKNAEPSRVDIRFKLISDSICLYVDSSTEQHLFRLLFCCLTFQRSLLACETPIFIRGGIAKGKVYADGDIIFGPGLITAYQMEEFNAKYPRIIITNDLLRPFRDSNGKYYISNIEDFAFRDLDGFYTVNYFRYLVKFQPEECLSTKVKAFVNNVLDHTIDSSLREKYNYVLTNILREEELFAVAKTTTR